MVEWYPPIPITNQTAPPVLGRHASDLSARRLVRTRANSSTFSIQVWVGVCVLARDGMDFVLVIDLKLGMGRINRECLSVCLSGLAVPLLGARLLAHLSALHTINMP